MERIVPMKELATVLEQLYQEGYDLIVAVPLTVRKVECYAKPRLCLGEDKIFLDDGLLVVKEYHIVAHKQTSLKPSKIFRWLVGNRPRS